MDEKVAILLLAFFSNSTPAGLLRHSSYSLLAMTKSLNRHHEAIKNGCGDPVKLNKVYL
jgi:hypothetical protein